MQLTQNEVIAFNECIADINEFLQLYEQKYMKFFNMDMGVMEDGTGFCLETDYAGGFGFPNQPSRMMQTHIYMSRDLEDYLNTEVSFPIGKVGTAGSVLKQIFMLLQSRFGMTDEELYFALDKEYFTVFISYKISVMDADTYTELLETLQYVIDCSMHMLTNTDVANKEYYVSAIAGQLQQA